MKKQLTIGIILIAIFMGYVGYKAIVPNWGLEKQHITIRVILKNNKIVIWSKDLPAIHPFILVARNSDNTYYLQFYNRAHLFGNWGYVTKSAVAYEIDRSNSKKGNRWKIY